MSTGAESDQLVAGEFLGARSGNTLPPRSGASMEERGDPHAGPNLPISFVGPEMFCSRSTGGDGACRGTCCGNPSTSLSTTRVHQTTFANGHPEHNYPINHGIGYATEFEYSVMDAYQAESSTIGTPSIGQQWESAGFIVHPPSTETQQARQVDTNSHSRFFWRSSVSPSGGQYPGGNDDGVFFVVSRNRRNPVARIALDKASLTQTGAFRIFDVELDESLELSYIHTDVADELLLDLLILPTVKPRTVITRNFVCEAKRFVTMASWPCLGTHRPPDSGYDRVDLSVAAVPHQMHGITIVFGRPAIEKLGLQHLASRGQFVMPAPGGSPKETYNSLATQPPASVAVDSFGAAGSLCIDPQLLRPVNGSTVQHSAGSFNLSYNSASSSATTAPSSVVTALGSGFDDFNLFQNHNCGYDGERGLDETDASEIYAPWQERPHAG
jgi:hypothetical protein